MKLMIVTDAWHPQVNGVVRTYENLSKELQEMGHKVCIVGPKDFPLSTPLPGYGEIQLVLFAYTFLKKKIEQEQPDFIHIAVEGPLGWAARKYCRKFDKPFTTSYHTHFPDYLAKRFGHIHPTLGRWIHNLAIRVIRGFHAPAKAMMIATESLENQLNEWEFKTPKHRLSRGVDLDQFYAGEKTLFKEMKKPVALYVGRVAIEKNLEDFLQMDWPGSKVIVGDGPSLNMLRKKYPEALFTGKKVGQELAEHYRSSDLFVFPSRTDTFGIVLIEALASGLPVAAYNVTGPKDIITENFLGALHDTDLGIAAKEAMKNGTPEMREGYVKSYYTWRNAAKQFEKALLT